MKLVTEQNGWVVFTIEGLGVNRERKAKDGRTVWFKVSNPSEYNILFAYPRHPGAGPQPEGTLTAIEIEDILVHLGKIVDNALDRMEESKGEF